uniref:G-protein coupled receptors family 1 profile domain-containing protein n=1 Tax=Sus scrofa TaxID=9823 RepID=A0A8D1EJB8_PIG
MREKLCIWLLAGSCLLFCADALTYTLLLARLSFCADNIIPHFFCHLAALLKVSCLDTPLNELVIFTVGGTLFILLLSSIMGSYVCIGTTVLSVSSTKRFFKVFSTCGSHLFVVSLYYGTLASVYFFSSSWDSNDKDIISSAMYAAVTPMLNPFIYHPRNRDMK